MLRVVWLEKYAAFRLFKCHCQNYNFYFCDLEQEGAQTASWLKDVATLAEWRVFSLVLQNFQFKQGLYKGSDAVQNLHIDVINQRGCLI